MSQWLKTKLLLMALVLSGCMPIERIREIREVPVARQAPTERIVIQKVAAPVEGCGYVLSEYADFSRFSDDAKRDEIRALKGRIKASNNPCDTLRLALYHSVPGKLRQTDETIAELLDGLNSNDNRLGSSDRATMLLLRNEMNNRSLVARKTDRNAATLDQQRAENRQLLQRLAELQLQLDQLKSLETNIAPK